MQPSHNLLARTTLAGGVMQPASKRSAIPTLSDALLSFGGAHLESHVRDALPVPHSPRGGGRVTLYPDA